MSKIFSIEKAIEFSKQLRNDGKTLVLVGGCFDILHIGHIRFLEKAKTEGDALFVMIEHDSTIKEKKGENRPINTQKDRSEILASLRMVDGVITMPSGADDAFYDRLVNQLKPAIIATTAGDPWRKHKERQAKALGAKVVDVIEEVSNKSTTNVIAILQEL